MSRSDDAALEELLSYVPPGWVWPRGEDTLLAALLWPLAAGIAIIEKQAEDMMAEIDPRTAVHCLPDFERVLGPDPCGRDPSTMSLNERQMLAHSRWTARGGQSIPYYVDQAAKQGVPITVKEFKPSEADLLCADDELIEDPEQFAWVVELALTKITEFTAGESEANDYLYETLLSGVECDIRRAKPAHTDVAFSYV
ncbi:YmfQ family protein [Microvirga terricola]|uniref:DUF2313 domain-containing protein n=1 Tax=Microvirga terricola TaxID=2719797 RepID=A0ABX0V722_9HYPH|nr:putative phage tail protein [Microvirga terricola]NIX75378.1 DUF2313 domain-containing protein [Microvirga terricola]